VALAVSLVATEAPTGFDNLTNGFVTQAEFDEAIEGFREQEGIEDGLGPVYNAQSCGECHQNPVTGATGVISGLRSPGTSTGEPGSWQEAAKITPGKDKKASAKRRSRLIALPPCGYTRTRSSETAKDRRDTRARRVGESAPATPRPGYVKARWAIVRRPV
jgi:hypothetical protein